MTPGNQLKNQHLLWRAGFGPQAEDIEQLRNHSPQAVLRALVKDSMEAPSYLEVAGNMFNGLMMGIGEAGNLQQRELSPDQKKQFFKKSREDIQSLNLAWLEEMVNSRAQLREKMAFFWHGHFASRNLNIYYQQLLLDIIRRNALGSFRQLLFAVSKSAAMINFLNNNQNRKDHPNENFAREVMELFTMGRGHYSEQDVKEAARAFTGWGATLNGDFVFRNPQHDPGTKTVLGQTGDWDGDDVLRILLQQKQTALFITRKVFRFFVNEKEDEARIGWLAQRFYQSDYDILSLMEDIFSSDWFFDEAHIGRRIKSPIELIAGIRRMLPMEIENPEVQLLLQRLLGQLLFFPPNVAGWPGGIHWIDSSSLMLRLRIPHLISASDEIHQHPKEDDDQFMGMREKFNKSYERRGQAGAGTGQWVRANIQWDDYLKNFAKSDRSAILPEIESILLQQPAGITEEGFRNYIDATNQDSYIRSLTLLMMGSPEYQLC